MAPSLSPTLAQVRVPPPRAHVSPRAWLLSGMCVVLALVAGLVAQGLTHLIGFITNVAFYGRFDATITSPADNTLGWKVVLVPVVGGLVVGVMARFGSAAIRGHGIPEAMEQVLFNKSKIPARLTFLKPLSAAIAIGTGGPFGAEGPIIATGGAMGSLIGQLVRTTADERKTLLAAGAAAGMSATFGSPVSAVLLAIELLLFEYRIRSMVPVALASVAACGVRVAFVGAAPAFDMPDVAEPHLAALAVYVVIGALLGVVATFVTRLVYRIEDAFEKLLPVHWMWWPAIGAVAVGVCGYYSPHTLGVGYDNIEHILSGELAGKAMLFFVVMKFISWALALGSGTSGGTLAPLLTIGGGVGAALGALALRIFAHVDIDVRVAALVGMAAMFAGASRALLASVIFAFEATRQAPGLLPLLGGCAAAFLVSSMMMKHSIMTEKIARRGARVVAEYGVDFLEQLSVSDIAAAPVHTLLADDSLEGIRKWMASGAPEASHQGYPVVDAAGDLVGVVTRRDLHDGEPAGTRRVRDVVKRGCAVAFDDGSAREAADHMVMEGVGRLPVVARAAPRRCVGIITRSDLLAAHRRRLDEASVTDAPRRFPFPNALRMRRANGDAAAAAEADDE